MNIINHSSIVIRKLVDLKKQYLWETKKKFIRRNKKNYEKFIWQIFMVFFFSVEMRLFVLWIVYKIKKKSHFHFILSSICKKKSNHCLYRVLSDYK